MLSAGGARTVICKAALTCGSTFTYCNTAIAHHLHWFDQSAARHPNSLPLLSQTPLGLESP